MMVFRYYGKAGYQAASMNWAKGSLDVNLEKKHVIITGANAGRQIDINAEKFS
jgi:hypothetical protein